MGSVLVAYATKNGSTKEVAEAVASALRERGVTAHVESAGDVKDLADYSAVVLGTAFYMFRALKGARHFLTRHHKALAGMPVAVFGMGPLEDKPEDFEDARKRLGAWLTKYPDVKPRATTVFGGVLDPAKLSFPFNNPGMKAMGPSDIRDWDAIKAWAEGLPEAFGPAEGSGSQ